MITKKFYRNGQLVGSWQGEEQDEVKPVPPWNWLHTEARAGRLTPEILATKFRAMIPQYGCACLAGWDEVLLRIPFHSADQFAWSVDVHNAINAKLGKPILSLSAASFLYPAP